MSKTIVHETPWGTFHTADDQAVAWAYAPSEGGEFDTCSECDADGAPWLCLDGGDTLCDDCADTEIDVIACDCGDAK